MEKINLLKQFSRSACFPALTAEELKIFILLLVSANEANMSGKIELNQMERIGTKICPPLELKRAMNSLADKGLIAMEELTAGCEGKDCGIRFTLKEYACR